MIKILHLYYDLLNQYGEQGNILALKDSFRNQNVEVSIDLLSCGDKIDFKKYDLPHLLIPVIILIKPFSFLLINLFK